MFDSEYEGLTEHYKENSGGLITDPDGDKVKMRWCSKSDDRQATEGSIRASYSQYLSHSTLQSPLVMLTFTLVWLFWLFYEYCPEKPYLLVHNILITRFTRFTRLLDHGCGCGINSHTVRDLILYTDLMSFYAQIRVLFERIRTACL